MTASNALFTGIAKADIIRDRTVVITAANSGSYLQTIAHSGTPGNLDFVEGYYNLCLDGSQGGDIVRRVLIGCPFTTNSTSAGLGASWQMAIAGVKLPQIGSNSALEAIIEVSGSGVFIRNDLGALAAGRLGTGI